MPLTPIQAAVLKLVAKNRSDDSYLAGGAAIHAAPHSIRFSNDLDFFNDSEERVASAFAQDHKTLLDAGFSISVEISQPGYIRATAHLEADATKIEWAHDTAWRFLPTQKSELLGWSLAPIDLALNKLLALVGRNEARDFIDTLHMHQHTLGLGAMIWAACGKDPGLTPQSCLELLKRKGRYREEDFIRLHLKEPIELPKLRIEWRDALEDAENFIFKRPADELGCLYYDVAKKKFVQTASHEGIVPHYGRPGGVVPLV